jgi:O-antigen ligase
MTTTDGGVGHEGAGCRCARCARARSAFRWWIAMLVAVMFAPPLTLGFTATRSTVSPAILVAIAYLPSRVLRLRGRFPSAGTPYGVVTMAVTAYVALHAVYYLAAERNLLVFLMEAQWAAYFAAFASVLFDLQQLPGARARVVRSLLVAILVESGLGAVSAFTGPIFDVGAWHEDRFGIGVYRATGTLGSPNGFAGVMAVGVLLALFERRAALPLPRAITLAPLLLALFWSQSKSGWLAFLAASTVALLVRFVARASARDFLLALGVGVFIVALTRTPAVWDELERDYTERSIFGAEVLEQYVRAAPLREIFGLGFRQTARIDHETRGWLTAHNSYLSLLAELGAVGLLLLAAVWAATLREIARGADFSMLGVLACILLHVYTEAFLYGSVYVLLMLAVLSFSSMARAEVRRAASPLALDVAR